MQHKHKKGLKKSSTNFRREQATHFWLRARKTKFKVLKQKRVTFLGKNSETKATLKLERRFAPYTLPNFQGTVI